MLIITNTGFNVFLFSQTKTILFHDTDITIDGTFAEVVWQALPKHTGFYITCASDRLQRVPI